MQRNITGIYIRYQNPENNEWENWCIEDIPEDKRTEFLNTKNKEWINGLVNLICTTLNNICEQLNITREGI